MKKLKFIFSTMPIFLAQSAFAATTCIVNGVEVPCEEAAPGATAAMIAFFLFFAVISLGILALWLWALIDVVKSNNKNKVAWVLVIVFLQGLGAIIYLIFGRKSHNQTPAEHPETLSPQNPENQNPPQPSDQNQQNG